MKTLLCTGVLSLLISCSFTAQSAVNKDISSRGSSDSSQSVAKSTSQLTGKIDLNQADVNALSHSAKGIGVKRAEAIIKYRQAHGPFKSVMELASVPGLGGNFVKKHTMELEKTFKIN